MRKKISALIIFAIICSLAIPGIARANSSSDANLSSLVLSNTLLSPAFSPTTYSGCTGSVARSTSSIIITPTVEDSSATYNITVKLANTTKASGSSPVSFSVIGANTYTITIEVTAGDGVTKQTYTVTAAKVSNDADTFLYYRSSSTVGLAISAGALTPDFDPGILNYSDSVLNNVSAVTVTPTADSSPMVETIKVDGSTVASGSPSDPINLNVGANTISILVTAQNGATQTYTITVTRAGATANLGSLAISGGTALSPAFDYNTTSYTASVPYGLSSVTVTPTADSGSATITVNGTPVASGSASAPISVTAAGVSIPITIAVTNGALQQTYTVNAIQDYNFDGYPLQVASSKTIRGQLFVDGGHGLQTAAAGSPYTQVFGNGSEPVPAGQVTWARLYVGVWGGTQNETGTLDITFNNKPLGTVGIGQNGPSGPAAWLLGTGYGVWWLAVDVTDKVVAGSINTVQLASSKISNSFDGRIYGSVLVAAVAQPDGPTVSYAVTEGHEELNQKDGVLSYVQPLNLPAGGNISGPADLTTIFLTGHPGTPDSLSINDHLLSTDAATGSGTDLNGDTWGGDTGGSWGGGTATSYFDLKHWDVTGMVAQSNSVNYTLGSETYLDPVVTILSTRSSSDATLSDLTINSGSLNPGFAPGITSYTDSVANSVYSITVTPTASDSHASISVNGTAVASGATSQEIGLSTGANTVSVTVTAQDGSTQTYSVKVNRAAPPAGAPAISPSGGAYSAPQSITVSISANLGVDQSVYYTTDGSDSAFTVAGSIYYTGPFALQLSQGRTTVQAAVYDSGTGVWSGVTTAVFTVSGGGATQSTDATLSNLALSSGILKPSFASTTTSYTASVDNSISSLTVTPTANESHASISVNGTAVASGQASAPIGLSVGDNAVSILVYAQDGIATRAYTITVSRDSSSSGGTPGSEAPTVTGISPTSGPYSGGSKVTITGTGFTGATRVSFGTKAVTSTSSLDSAYFTINSDTSITVVSPSVDTGDVTVDVTVTGPKGVSTTSSNDKFTYLAPDGYKGMNSGASPLTTATHNTDTGGGLIFTRGDSQYCSKLPVGGTYIVHLPVTGIPAGASVKVARLYGYYCWSVSGQPAQFSITLNGRGANQLNSYSDVKGMDPWNYPFGTVSFDATGILTGNGSYAAVLTNTGSGSICPFGIGLVVVYHDPKGQPFEYWLNEGADIIWPGDGVTVAEATTRSTFDGTIDTSKIAGAELITVVTSGNKGLNTLTFNGGAWHGVYADPTQLAVGDTDVTNYLQGSGNKLSIDSEGSGVMGEGEGASSFSQADTMCPSNAFLVVTYNSPESVGGGTITPGVGGTVSLGSDITVKIPAGALNEISDVDVKIQKVNKTPVIPSGLSLLGSAFELRVGGSSTYKFTKPVTLTFTIDPASLAAGETPSIYYYDEKSSQWVSLGGTVTGNTITVDVDHFTKFAVLAKEAASLPTVAPEVAAVVRQVSFSDVPADFWASSVIDEVYGLGYIGGYPDGTFRPNNSITRAEFVTILVRAYKLSVVGGVYFDDTVSHWACDNIGTAYVNGIATGYSDNTFGPDDPVTREQMAAMIVKAAKIKAATAEITFQDRDQISTWARDALAAVAQSGIMKGYPDGSFHPQQHATRAEAVASVANALKGSQ